MPLEPQREPGNPKDETPSQDKKEKTPANNTTQTSQPKNDTDNMPKNSVGAMVHGNLSLQPRSRYQQDDTASRRSRQPPQGEAADLFAVGAWADPQMSGGASLDDEDLDAHFQSRRGPESKKSSR